MTGAGYLSPKSVDNACVEDSNNHRYQEVTNIKRHICFESTWKYRKSLSAFRHHT